MTEVEKVVQELETAGLCSEDLDELVHSTASNDATNTNNSGIAEQVTYLLSNGWLPTEIYTSAAEVLEDQ